MEQTTWDIGELVAKADALRDARSFRAAAEGYRAALAVEPMRADLWAQLGNMSKDGGDFPGAIAAYTEALRYEPRNADTFLQLGRAYRLWGHRDEAFEAFARALDLTPGLHDAIREVVDLGLSWRLERSSGIGTTLALSVNKALDDLKAAIRSIEQELPTIRALTAIPVEHYDEFRRVYHVPPADPIAGSPPVALVVVGRAPLAAVLACLTAVKAQRLAAAGVLMPALRRDELAPARAFLPEAAALASSVAETAPPGAIVAAGVAAFPDARWYVLTQEPVLLDPEALGWLVGEAERSAAVAAFCDEDVVVEHGTAGRRHVEPRLRGRLDPEQVSQGFNLGTLLAVRRDCLVASLATLGDAGDPSTFWSRLVAAVSAQGRVAQVPQVLVSRFAEVARTAALAPDASAGRSAVPSPPPHLLEADLAVVIPTRNGLAQVEPCVAALVATASRADRLEITIIDNGSDDPATLAWLAEGQRSGRFAVVRLAAPFNWSQLNNHAVAATSSPLLLFLNDDVELVSPGWDAALRALLARPEVGVVGARLAYPDRTLQHAGMVLGVNGVSEHEGRGEPMDAQGPLGRWQTRRSVSAVTGAFFACRREVFASVGGFDAEDLPVWFSDVDFCLKVADRGLRVLYEPRLAAIHHESKTLCSAFEDPVRSAAFEYAASVMRARWGARVADDPWYSPQYSRFAKPYARLAAPGDRSRDGATVDR